MSPYDDGVCTLRVKQDGLKGDLILTGRFVLEFALRLGQIKRKEGKEMNIIIQPSWKILYKQVCTSRQFYKCTGVSGFLYAGGTVFVSAKIVCLKYRCLS